MALEDFEKSLAESQALAGQSHSAEKSERKHYKHHHHRHHHKRRHHDERSAHHHRHKRARRSQSVSSEGEKAAEGNPDVGSIVEDITSHNDDGPLTALSRAQKVVAPPANLRRDSWMEMPTTNDVEFTQKGAKLPPKSSISGPGKPDFELKIHENELNKHHLLDLAEGKAMQAEMLGQPAQHEVDYTFGDAGSQWRMTKLKAVFRQAEESGRPIDDVAIDHFGDLMAFDDAKEERTELDRRETYGPDYVGKEKPNGDLFQERKLSEGVKRKPSLAPKEGQAHGEVEPSIRSVETQVSMSPTLDQTALNRLKARMMKAKLRGAADAATLEAEYNAALTSSTNGMHSDTVVLRAMENRMLAGGRKGEVKSIDNKRGRERGLVEENEDMSIEDMVREERRTRYQIGGEGQRFAERIAKDGKFDNDLDYLDENAAKLARRVHKSEINLKNSAVSDYQRMNRVIDNCALCHQEDSNRPPIAPVVSLATRVYLSLPTEPEISKGGACIVPVQHHGNLLECDDDEWEEIRNFMKSLSRMYHGRGMGVIFYENATTPQRRKHAAMEAVPLPPNLAEDAPMFFKEAFLTTDEEWTQHKKIIDTLSKAKEGLGKLAFRRTLVKEMPYFHVWYQIDGGMGHIVEDSNRWPKGDLFAREIIGGMLNKGPEVIKKQGRWGNGLDKRLDGFRKRWTDFDWTHVLTNG